MSDTPDPPEPAVPVDAASPRLSGTTLADLEQAAAVLAVEAPEALLHHWLDLSSALVARARQVRRQVEQVAVEWITLHGPIRIGDALYTVGHPKTVKCADAARCMTLVLDACGGDVEAVTDHLRSDPFKYGSVRTLLGDGVYDELFVTEVRPKLVEGGPQLMSVNTRFARPRSAPAPRDITAEYDPE